MADDVTLEDLQKVYKRLDALEAGLKEANRLQKISDDYAKDISTNSADDIKSVRDSIKKLESRVTDVEKKLPKK